MVITMILIQYVFANTPWFSLLFTSENMLQYFLVTSSFVRVIIWRKKKKLKLNRKKEQLHDVS